MAHKKYNHMYVVAFTLENDDKLPVGVTNLQFTNALLNRICDLNEHDEWYEAVGDPNDTYEVKQ